MWPCGLWPGAYVGHTHIYTRVIPGVAILCLLSWYDPEACQRYRSFADLADLAAAAEKAVVEDAAAGKAATAEKAEKAAAETAAADKAATEKAAAGEKAAVEKAAAEREWACSAEHRQGR